MTPRRRIELLMACTLGILVASGFWQMYGAWLWSARGD
jgi:hypothetical protein